MQGGLTPVSACTLDRKVGLNCSLFNRWLKAPNGPNCPADQMLLPRESCVAQSFAGSAEKAMPGLVCFASEVGER